MVGHAAFAWRVIHFPDLPSALIGANDYHMHSFLDFGEEQALSILNPGQRGGIGKNQVWLAAQDGHFPRIPRGPGPIGNAGAIGGKDRAEFDARIVSQLDGLPIRQQLDVNLTRP